MYIQNFIEDRRACVLSNCDIVSLAKIYLFESKLREVYMEFPVYFLV